MLVLDLFTGHLFQGKSKMLSAIVMIVSMIATGFRIVFKENRK